VGNTVNIKEATYTNDIGDSQLSVVWQDPDFDPGFPAVYNMCACLRSRRLAGQPMMPGS